MLTRRELLARGTTVLLLVPIIGCTASSSPTTGGVSCAGTDTLSSVDVSHTHTLCILNSDLTSPPAAGATYTTSNEGSHTHQVMLTQAQLTSLNNGQTVTVVSTNDVDPSNGTPHTHQFSITKGNNTGKGSGGGPDPGGW